MLSLFSRSTIVSLLIAVGVCSFSEVAAADDSWVIKNWNLKADEVPPLRARIGVLSPRVTSSNPDAVRFVHQGVNLMMGYWDVEAYRSFLHAARLDPDCGMAYWGMALTMIGSESELQPQMDAAANKAFEIAGLIDGVEGKPMSDEEREFITGLAFYLKHGPEAFVKSMAGISKANPENRLARLMHILFLRDGYNEEGEPNEGQREALVLLEKYLTKFPDWKPYPFCGIGATTSSVNTSPPEIHNSPSGKDYEQEKREIDGLSRRFVPPSYCHRRPRIRVY